jgi:class 3 adenylate cyclase
MLDVNLDIDTTAMLETIRVPTLILHNIRDVFIPVEFSRYLADHVPDAKLVEMDGDDHLFWFSNPDAVVSELEDFLVGARVETTPDRVLSTLVFTDVVESTRQAARLGDSRWRELLDTHERLARENVAHFQGRIVGMTGDGLLATFDGPARGVTCAVRLQKALSRAGLECRAGVHTGEIEIRGDEIGGIGVHIAARVMSLAGPGEVLASRTVKDLSVGGEISFTDRGVHTLRGLEEPWQLFAVTV